MSTLLPVKVILCFYRFTEWWSKCRCECPQGSVQRVELCLYLLSGKTSCRQISWNLGVARLFVEIIVSLWNWTGTSTTMLPRRLSNFRSATSEPISHDTRFHENWIPYYYCNPTPSRASWPMAVHLSNESSTAIGCLTSDRFRSQYEYGALGAVVRHMAAELKDTCCCDVTIGFGKSLVTLTFWHHWNWLKIVQMTASTIGMIKQALQTSFHSSGCATDTIHNVMDTPERTKAKINRFLGSEISRRFRRRFKKLAPYLQSLVSSHLKSDTPHGVNIVLSSRCIVWSHLTEIQSNVCSFYMIIRTRNRFQWIDCLKW